MTKSKSRVIKSNENKNIAFKSDNVGDTQLNVSLLAVNDEELAISILDEANIIRKEIIRKY